MQIDLETLEKRAFVMRKSSLDAIETFPDNVEQEIARLLFQYGITGSHDPCDEEIMAILRPMKVAIDSEQNRYYNKQLVNCYSNMARLKKMYATADNVRKKYTDVEKALQRVYSEAVHHNIPDIRTSIGQAIGITMLMEFNKEIVFPQVLVRHFDSIGLPIRSKKNDSTPVSPGPQRQVDMRFFNRG